MTDRPLIVLPDGSTRPFNDAEYAQWLIDSQPRAPEPPDGPTLSDWRVGLLLWNRLDDVADRIKALCDDGEPIGFIAKERFERANWVFRTQLLLLKDALGFTTADVEESLWRADRVAQGDLSGIYP